MEKVVLIIVAVYSTNNTAYILVRGFVYIKITTRNNLLVLK